MNRAVAEEIKLCAVEIVLPPSTSSSDKLFSRIATLLFILVAGLMTVYASHFVAAHQSSREWPKLNGLEGASSVTLRL
jgi:hypothetical protein